MGRRWAAAISLVAPLWVNAATAPAVDLASVITPFAPFENVFDPERFAYENVQFFGEGVTRTSSGLSAPVKARWVEGVEGPGAFEVGWGADSGLDINIWTGIRATDFLLSLADNKVYVDVR